MSNIFEEVDKADKANPFLVADKLPLSEANREDPIMLGNDIRSLGTQAQREKMSGLGMMADMGMEAGGATAGQAAGIPFAPATFGASVPIGGAIGGMAGNYGAQRRRISAGEQPKFMLGQMLGAGVAGAIPGASAESAGARAFLTRGGINAAGNMAATATTSAVDQGKMPSAGELGIAAAGGLAAGAFRGTNVNQKEVERQIANSVKDQTLAEMRMAGYVVDPSKVNPNPVTTLLQSIGGKAATAQQAVILNQEVTNALAKKALGSDPVTPITDKLLAAKRAEWGQAYKQIDDIAATGEKNLAALKKSRFTAADPHELAIQQADPATVKEASSLAIQAGADLKAYREANYGAKQAFSAYKMTGDPTALENAKAFREAAGAAHDKIVASVKEMGMPDLAKDLQTARVGYAKAAQIEKALNKATGDVSAPTIGNAFDDGAPLTDELATIGKGENAMGNYLREAASTPPPGPNYLKGLVSGGAAMAGGAAGASKFGQPGAIAGAAAGALLPVLLEDKARKVLLSQTYQRMFATPRYQTQIPAYADQFARQGVLNATGADNPFLQKGP